MLCHVCAGNNFVYSPEIFFIIYLTGENLANKSSFIIDMFQTPLNATKFLFLKMNFRENKGAHIKRGCKNKLTQTSVALTLLVT